MARRGRGLLKPIRKLGKAPTLFPRARKVRTYYNPDYRPPVQPIGQLNIPETEIYRALTELKLNFQTQVPLNGGNFLGGARADFILPDYRIVLDFKGPWHFTAYGTGRDLLKDLVYTESGLTRHTLNDDDMRRLKPRILEIIGRPT